MTRSRVDFEEVVVQCASCGKKMKILKRKGYQVKGLLCQKCGQANQKNTISLSLVKWIIPIQK